MTREELIKALQTAAKDHKVLMLGDGLYEESKRVLGENFDPTDPQKMAGILEEENKKTEEQKKKIEEEIKNAEKGAKEIDKPLETRALNKQDLEILLEEYDKHKGWQDVRKIAEAIQRGNPLLREVGIQNIILIIEKKVGIEKALIKQGLETEKAEKRSDEILIIETELREQTKEKVTEENINEVTEKIIEVINLKLPVEETKVKIAQRLDDLGIEELKINTVVQKIIEDIAIKNEVLEIKTKLEEVNKGAIAEGEIEVVAEKIVEIANLKLTPKETREKVVVELKDLGIKDQPFVEVVQEIAEEQVKERGEIKNDISTPKTEVKEAVAAEEVLEIKTKLEEVNKGAIAEGEIEVVAEKIVEIANLKLTPKETREKVVVELKDLGIKNPEFISTVQEVTADITAVKVVEEQVELISERIHKEIAEIVSVNIGEKKDEKIREIIETKVRRVFLEPTLKLSDYEVVTEKEGSVTTKSTGNNITQEIENILGISLDENKKTQVGKTIKTSDEILAKLLILKGEEVDNFRGQKLENEVFTRITEDGETVKKARDMAKFVRELSFPKNGESITEIEIKAEQILRDNEFYKKDSAIKLEVEPNTARNHAINVRNLLRSPTSIRENIDRILNLPKKLDGIKKVDSLKNTASVLKNNEKLIKSLEFVQEISRFREIFNAPGIKVLGQLGQILKIPALQEYGVQMAYRFGGEMVGAMATHISQFGMEQGIKSIAGQFFSTGTVTAVKAGTSLAARGAMTVAGTAAVDGAVATVGAATGPPGWVVAAAIFVAQIAYNVGKKLFGGVKNRFDQLAKTLNLDFGTSKFLKENLGGLLGGVLDTGLKIGGGVVMLMLAIPAMMAAVTLPILLIVAPIIAIPLYNHFQTATTQVSSLVAPMGMGDRELVVGPQVTIVPGKPVGGECDVSSRVALVKQCDPKWGATPLNGGGRGTICNSGCGPTSVAMMLHKTPVEVIFEPGSAYSGMGEEGSTLQQAYNTMVKKVGSGAVNIDWACTQESIKRSICDGNKVVMVNADFYGSSLGTVGHYFLAVAINGGKIVSYDPAYNTTTPFDSIHATGYIINGTTKGCLLVNADAL